MELEFCNYNDCLSWIETQLVIRKMQDSAARKIQAAFRIWIWRKNILWNPNTDIGMQYLEIISHRNCDLI